MNNFNLLGLPEALNYALHHMQFSKPTPIQAQTIPHALGGRDILGSAQTGTGKTAAFGIPIAARLLSNQRGSALVMAPTRELASQVMDQLQAILGKRSQIKTALLIGGDSMSNQLKQLKNRPRLLVGTPGRINDHLQQGNLMLHDAGILVLDETDRMLDMGFTNQIEKILKFMPKTRQTMLFSATLPKNIIKISEKYLNNPVRVSVDNALSPAKKIQHDVLRVSEEGKYRSLLSELDVRKGSIIVFVKTKFGTEKMAKKLSMAGHDADAIHGDLRQSKREIVIANFRNKKYRILVATDVAARGLDIPHIEHVINYDLPHCAEDYIHRIGRTARAGAEGSAMCLLTPANIGKWNVINRLMNPNDPNKMANERGYRKRSGKSSGFKSNGTKFNKCVNREAA
jgi:superfamily II DNA/RNA helicase